MVWFEKGFSIRAWNTITALCWLLLPSASEAAHYSWRYTKFLLFRVQSPAELYMVEISIFAMEMSAFKMRGWSA